MAPKRVGWKNLSSAQRARYLAAGKSGKLTGEPLLDDATREREVRTYYNAGGSLQRANGKKLIRPAWAAPQGPTNLAKVNLLRPEDKKELRKWRAGRAAPKWLPRSPERMRDDVAAILSEIDVAPLRWREVTIRPSGSGRYLLTITISRRKDAFVTTLPDWDAVSDLGRLLNDHARLQLVTTKHERRLLEKQWRNDSGQRLHIKVDIADTDVKARKATNTKKLTAPAKGKNGAFKEPPANALSGGPTKRTPPGTGPVHTRTPRKAKKAAASSRRVVATRVKQQASGRGDAIQRSKQQKGKRRK